MSVIQFKCKKCGAQEYIIKEVPNGSNVHKGLHCAKCGAGEKWLSKDDVVCGAETTKKTTAKERKELKDELRSKVEYIQEQDEVIKEYKHRAARAERALKSALNDETCYFCNMNAPCKVGRDWGSSECIQSLLQQAEKELEEEGEDG